MSHDATRSVPLGAESSAGLLLTKRVFSCHLSFQLNGTFALSRSGIPEFIKSVVYFPIN